MERFVIHQHHHYGWTTAVHEAANLDEAMRQDILHHHVWLADYPHEIEFKDGRYVVTYTGPIRTLPFGRVQYPGDVWFADGIRGGEEDDCTTCGGTGINHYYSWRQCWVCGERLIDGGVETRDGRGTGKRRMIAEKVN